MHHRVSTEMARWPSYFCTAGTALFLVSFPILCCSLTSQQDFLFSRRTSGLSLFSPNIFPVEPVDADIGPCFFCSLQDSFIAEPYFGSAVVLLRVNIKLPFFRVDLQPFYSSVFFSLLVFSRKEVRLPDPAVSPDRYRLLVRPLVPPSSPANRIRTTAPFIDGARHLIPVTCVRMSTSPGPALPYFPFPGVTP